MPNYLNFIYVKYETESKTIEKHSPQVIHCCSVKERIMWKTEFHYKVTQLY